MVLTTRISSEGVVYRDLNGNAKMDPYEDSRLPTAERVADLLARMTLAEKVGQMFQAPLLIGADGSLSDGPPIGRPTTEMVLEREMRHFNVMFLNDLDEGARWHNRLQRLAERSRLGIPVTVSTDPRHVDRVNLGAAFSSGDMSRWPDTIGLAALRDPDVVQRFADIARQEYLAVGIRAALHPQVDLATEPRWARQNATFGSDVSLTTELLLAYLEGFQGAELGPSSVACMTKHFPGGGPQKDGEDPHFPYGREQVYPGDMFEHHLKPFVAAVEAGTSAIMPYYGMPIGLEYRGVAVEEVGFAYSRQMITDLLRDELGFTGIVCTDWSLVNDKDVLETNMQAKAWGVEHLTPIERLKRLIDAGCDQLGGEHCTGLLIDLLEQGLVSESRIDESVTRLLAVKFDLGLFEDPYVDETTVTAIAGREEFIEAGLAAQRRSLTLLSNPGAVLPVARGTRVFFENVDTDIAAEYATVVDTPDEAEVAIARANSPFELRDTGILLESAFRTGSLEFDDDELERLARLAATVPLVLDVRLERPAVLTPLVDRVASLLGSYGTSDRAFMDVVFGAAAPEGVLPFELPSSMAAVERSSSDVPNDTDSPLFPAGHGLRYRPDAEPDPETIAADGAGTTP